MDLGVILPRERIDTMGAMPFLSDIVELAKVGNFDLSKLRTLASAGAPIPPSPCIGPTAAPPITARKAC